MTPTVQVNVTRGAACNKAQLLRDPQVTKARQDFERAFAEALALGVGDEVADLIGDGRWWVSRSRRFARYRAWVKRKYGSDRARKNGGAMRDVSGEHSKNPELDEADISRVGQHPAPDDPVDCAQAQDRQRALQGPLRPVAGLHHQPQDRRRAAGDHRGR